MASQTRLDIFKLLVQAGNHGLSAGQLATHLHEPQNTLSMHVNSMIYAGLVRRRRDGSLVRYYARIEGMHHLIHFMLGDSSAGNEAPYAPALDSLAC